jgi:hypothetical protein
MYKAFGHPCKIPRKRLFWEQTPERTRHNSYKFHLEILPTAMLTESRHSHKQGTVVGRYSEPHKETKKVLVILNARSSRLGFNNLAETSKLNETERNFFVYFSEERHCFCDVYVVTYGKCLYYTPVVFNLFCSRTPRCNFSSTLYPQSCWCIIQVIHSL